MLQPSEEFVLGNSLPKITDRNARLTSRVGRPGHGAPEIATGGRDGVRRRNDECACFVHFHVVGGARVGFAPEFARCIYITRVFVVSERLLVSGLWWII